MFEIRDPNGWTGVGAEDLESARYACTIIAHEGYDLPLEIVPDGEHFSTEVLTGFDESGGPIWQRNSTTRRFDKAA